MALGRSQRTAIPAAAIRSTEIREPGRPRTGGGDVMNCTASEMEFRRCIDATDRVDETDTATGCGELEIEVAIGCARPIVAARQ
jgi:hypothetical protein